MIVVQETWICKPGQASKFAKMCKQMISEFPEQSDVMTDMTGQFNKVVMISKYESLSDYEKSFYNYNFISVLCFSTFTEFIAKRTFCIM